MPTVAEALRDTTPRFINVEEEDVADVLATIRSTLARFRRVPGKDYALDRFMKDPALALLCSNLRNVCYPAGWTVRQYMTAVALSMGGYTTYRCPSVDSFSGDDGLRRFNEWLSKSRFVYGDARQNAMTPKKRAYLSRCHAAQTFGIHYLTEGFTRSAAAGAVKDICPDWDYRTATYHEKLHAMYSALAQEDRTLPMRVLAPASFLWKHARHAISALLADEKEAAVGQGLVIL